MKRFFVILLGVLLCVSLIVSILFLSFEKMAFNSEYVSDRIADDKFKETLVTEVRAAIDSKTMLLPIGTQTFSATVSDDDIYDCGKQTVKIIFEHICGGSPITDNEFTSQKLYDEITEELNKYAVENSIEIQDDSVDSIYGTLCDAVTAKAKIISSQYIEKLPSLQSLEKYLPIGWAAVVVTALCFAGELLLGTAKTKHKIQCLYTAATPLWIGSAIVFIPMLIFRIYDLPSHIILNQSALKTIISNTLNLALSRILTISGALLAAATLMLIVGIILISRSYSKSDCQSQNTIPSKEPQEQLCKPNDLSGSNSDSHE